MAPVFFCFRGSGAWVRLVMSGSWIGGDVESGFFHCLVFFIGMYHQGDMPVWEIVLYIVKGIAQGGGQTDFDNLPSWLKLEVASELDRYMKEGAWGVITNGVVEDYGVYADAFIDKVDFTPWSLLNGTGFCQNAASDARSEFENSYFPELSVYERYISPHKLSGVLNIGWVDVFGDIPRRQPSDALLARLSDVLESVSPFIPFMGPDIELPHCMQCGAIKYARSNGSLLRNSELWVPDGDLIYASPLSIVHFIREHHYCPPDEYIECFMSVDLRQAFDSNKIYRDRLQKSGWRGTRLT